MVAYVFGYGQGTNVDPVLPYNALNKTVQGIVVFDSPLIQSWRCIITEPLLSGFTMFSTHQHRI
jgi:hypothetical protein